MQVTRAEVIEVEGATVLSRASLDAVVIEGQSRSEVSLVPLGVGLLAAFADREKEMARPVEHHATAEVHASRSADSTRVVVSGRVQQLIPGLPLIVRGVAETPTERFREDR